MKLSKVIESLFELEASSKQGTQDGVCSQIEHSTCSRMSGCSTCPMGMAASKTLRPLINQLKTMELIDDDD